MSELKHMERALRAAAAAIAAAAGGEVSWKSGGRGPVTEADLAADRVLREALPRAGEGWLSEETPDDRVRLERDSVWIVDPVDGTREFVRGVPEWSISIARAELGTAVAGGVFNPASGVLVLAAEGEGLRTEGLPPRASEPTVLASRSELKRGEWDRYDRAGYVVRPVGSVAYKLALVAAGVAAATWTLSPKHEWDVAGGAALLRLAGGEVRLVEGAPPRFNQPVPRVPGLRGLAPGEDSARWDRVEPAFGATV